MNHGYYLLNWKECISKKLNFRKRKIMKRKIRVNFVMDMLNKKEDI